MRVLIDECIDERFRSHFSGHDCQTVRYGGLAGLKNGDLLDAAESADFDVLLTVDQGIEYQQNLARRRIAIVILRGESSQLRDLLPLLPACPHQLESIRRGEVIRIPSQDEPSS